MKKIFLIPAVLLIFVICGFMVFPGAEPWTEAQLIKPKVLAQKLSEGNRDIYIYSIGPSGLIKNAVLIGETKDNANLQKLKERVSELPKNAHIVIYCGCCPFKNCPNIRPAFSLLNEMGFKHHKLLDLPQNLKVDWMDKGYPMKE